MTDAVQPRHGAELRGRRRRTKAAEPRSVQVKSRRQSQRGASNAAGGKGPLASEPGSRKSTKLPAEATEPAEGKGKQSRLLSARSSKPSKKMCFEMRPEETLPRVQLRGRSPPPTLLDGSWCPCGRRGSSREGRAHSRKVCCPQTRWRPRRARTRSRGSRQIPRRKPLTAVASSCEGHSGAPAAGRPVPRGAAALKGLRSCD